MTPRIRNLEKKKRGSWVDGGGGDMSLNIVLHVCISNDVNVLHIKNKVKKNKQKNPKRGAWVA